MIRLGFINLWGKAVQQKKTYRPSETSGLSAWPRASETWEARAFGSVGGIR